MDASDGTTRFTLGGHDVNGNPYVVRAADSARVYAEFCSLCMTASEKVVSIAADRASTGMDGTVDAISMATQVMQAFLPAYSYAMAYEWICATEMLGPDFDLSDDPISNVK